MVLAGVHVCILEKIDLLIQNGTLKAKRISSEGIYV